MQPHAVSYVITFWSTYYPWTFDHVIYISAYDVYKPFIRPPGKVKESYCCKISRKKVPRNMLYVTVCIDINIFNINNTDLKIDNKIKEKT
jgi:hypothetical protein